MTEQIPKGIKDIPRTALEEQMSMWLDQMKPIIMDAHTAQVDSNWGQVKHFVNLLRFNITTIEGIADELASRDEASKRLASGLGVGPVKESDGNKGWDGDCA